MAKLVHEVMNREVLTFGAQERSENALADLVALGVSAAPIVDEERRPLGVVSWRNLVGAGERPIAERMTSPAVTIGEDETIARSAEILARKGIRHLFVVDRRGAIVGALSTLDVLRAVTGHEVVHPSAFPHLDRSLGVTWTDDAPFELSASSVAPKGPGVLVLVESIPGASDLVVHAEATDDVRARLLSLLSSPPSDLGALEALLSHPGRVHFRAASIDDARKRSAVAKKVRAQGAKATRAEALR